MTNPKADSDYWYLASPYSKYPAGIEVAFQDICRIAGRLITLGVRVYSPIAHTHPIATYGDIDPYAHAIWLPADKPFMANAKGLIVAQMEGWDTSYGIGEEVKDFLAAEKPVTFLPQPIDDWTLAKLAEEQWQ